MAGFNFLGADEIISLAPTFFFSFPLNDVRVSVVPLSDARHRPRHDDDTLFDIEFQHCHRHSPSEYPASLIFHCPRLLRRSPCTRHYQPTATWIISITATARSSKDCIRSRSSTGCTEYPGWRNPTRYGGD